MSEHTSTPPNDPQEDARNVEIAADLLQHAGWLLTADRLRDLAARLRKQGGCCNSRQMQRLWQLEKLVVELQERVEAYERNAAELAAAEDMELPVGDGATPAFPGVQITFRFTPAETSAPDAVGVELGMELAFEYLDAREA